jgi:flagellar biosynthetic protein FliQ
MNATAVFEISREAIWVTLKMGAPCMLLALAVGLAVSLFQALTQIQEQTLTFVPKIVVMFLALIVLMPFMLTTLTTFTEGLADRIISGN